jgi:hypothetical protein
VVSPARAPAPLHQLHQVGQHLSPTPTSTLNRPLKRPRGGENSSVHWVLVGSAPHWVLGGCAPAPLDGKCSAATAAHLPVRVPAPLHQLHQVGQLLRAAEVQHGGQVAAHARPAGGDLDHLRGGVYQGGSGFGRSGGLPDPLIKGSAACMEGRSRRTPGRLVGDLDHLRRGLSRRLRVWEGRGSARPFDGPDPLIEGSAAWRAGLGGRPAGWWGILTACGGVQGLGGLGLSLKPSQAVR